MGDGVIERIDQPPGAFADEELVDVLGIKHRDSRYPRRRSCDSVLARDGQDSTWSEHPIHLVESLSDRAPVSKVLDRARREDRMEGLVGKPQVQRIHGRHLEALGLPRNWPVPARIR